MEPTRCVIIFLREIPSGEDGISLEKFEAYNGDLANGLVICGQSINPCIWRGFKTNSDVNKTVEAKINEVKDLVKTKIEEFKLNEALEAVWGLIHFGDQYVNEKKPRGINLCEADKIDSLIMQSLF